MNNFVDEFDDRIFHNGQVIGVKHGGSVHQPTITYSTKQMSLEGCCVKSVIGL
jgi:hypothetical protein